MLTWNQMIEPVIHHNSEGPNSNGSSLHSSQEEDDFNCFNMDRNWERRWGIILLRSKSISPPRTKWLHSSKHFS